MRVLAAFVLLLAGCATSQSPSLQNPSRFACADASRPASAQRLLIGTWQHVELTRIVDGKRLAPQSAAGDSIAHFYCDGTWDSFAPNFRSAGTFRWVNDAEIEQTILESNLAIQLGMVSVKRVVVDGANLEIQVHQSAEERARIMAPSSRLIDMDTVVITRFRRLANGGAK